MRIPPIVTSIRMMRMKRSGSEFQPDCMQPMEATITPHSRVSGLGVAWSLFTDNKISRSIEVMEFDTSLWDCVKTFVPLVKGLERLDFVLYVDQVLLFTENLHCNNYFPCAFVIKEVVWIIFVNIQYSLFKCDVSMTCEQSALFKDFFSPNVETCSSLPCIAHPYQSAVLWP